ncbi:MAG: adenylate/guanylate cyclase domain-containing protein [Steroidobacteraceae bacterium]
MGSDAELAILFADVVGSSRLFEALGDERASELVADCVDLMRRATEDHRGRVVKTMGDEVMSTFEQCDDALAAASAMQTRIGARKDLAVDGQPIMIRIGCHYGPVVIENRDVFGAAVHTANRMTSQAKAGQIIVTDAVVAELGEEWRGAVRQVDVAVPRGLHGEVGLFDVLWKPEDATSMVPSIAMPGEHRPIRLHLRCQGRELVLDGRDRLSATLGRAEENDLVVRGGLVSRIHARIEAAKNKFVLLDQSTNGTFVHADAGEESFLRRDSMSLRGSGTLGLGQIPEPGSPHTIEFECEE